MLADEEIETVPQPKTKHHDSAGRLTPVPDVPVNKPEEELLEGQTWTTLDMLGSTLPCAIGTRSFAFRPSTLGEARRRGAKLPEGVKAQPADAMAWSLALSLEQLQGVKLDEEDPSATVAKIQALPWCSVLYMLVYGARERRRTGRYVESDVRCPNTTCGKVQNLTLNLGDLKVRDWGKVEKLPQLDVDLTTGFEFPPGKTVKRVVIEPAPWGAMMGLSAGELGVPEEVTAAFLSRAIVEVDTTPGVRAAPPVAALSQLVPEDYDYLDESHVLLSGGPTLVLESRCSRCEQPIFVRVNWTRPDFFDGSSPEQRPRRKLRSR